MRTSPSSPVLGPSSALSQTPVRYVALGDSLTQGRGDQHPDGALRGFADLLAAGLSRANPAVTYANLARPSVRIGEVLTDQAPQLPGYRPDLITVIAGVNDVIAVRFDIDRSAAELDQLFGTIRHGAPGASVVTATLPDLSPVSGVARALRRRVARLNDATCWAAARHGVQIVDLAATLTLQGHDLALDRVHPGPSGHLLFARRFGLAVGVDVPAPQPVPGAQETGMARRAYRASVVAPRFVMRRLARGSLIAGQQPKQQVACTPRDVTLVA